MSAAAALARDARRRITIGLLVDRAGRGLVVAASLSAVMTMVDRVLHVHFPLFMAVGGLGLAALAWALVSAWRARPSVVEAAGRVDAALGLDDRLSTAVSLGRSVDPFAAVAVADGERMARSADVRRALPLRFGRAWRVWPVTAAAAIAVMMLAPAESRHARRAAVERAQQLEQARAVSAQVKESVREAQEAMKTVPGASAEEVRELDALERELASAGDELSGRDVHEAVSKASGALDSLAQIQEGLADKARSGADDLHDRLTSLPRAGKEEGELSRAVRGADLDEASRAASELLRPGRLDTPDERAAMARELNRLAEDLRSLPAARSPDRGESLEQRPGENGSVEEGQRGPARSDEPEKPAEKSPETAPPAGGAENQTRGLSEAMREAARRLDPAAGGSDDQRAPQSPQGSRSPDLSTNPLAQGQTKPNPQTAAEQQENNGAATRKDQQPTTDSEGRAFDAAKPESSPSAGDKGASSAPGEDARRGKESPAESSTARDAAGSPAPAKSNESKGASQPRSDDPDGGKEPERRSPDAPKQTEETNSGGTKQAVSKDGAGSQRDSAKGESSPSGARDKGSPPQDKPPPAGEKQTGQQPLTQDQAEGLRRVAERLSKLSEAPGQAAARERLAEQLREGARRVEQSGDPAGGQERKPWMRRISAGRGAAGPGGGSGVSRVGDREPQPGSHGAETPSYQPRTEIVDGRRASDASASPSGNDQVVAEWLGDGERRSPSAGASEVHQRLRDAARSAEQAIGDRTVPSRYDRVLREYFKRLPQQVGHTSPPAAPVSAPARDGGVGPS